MTEEEFFEFLDSESKKIKEKNFIVPLTDYHRKYAVSGTDNQNESSNKKI
jgi:hypothetical protein